MKPISTLLFLATLGGLSHSAAAQTPVPLVAATSTWKYLDNGSNQGTAWRTATFNNAAWASGAAELGYGDSDETTVVGYGSDAANKHVTTYFRQQFQVTSLAGYAQLKLRLIRDDGAVVYLNGVEIFRDNLPTGAIAYTTPASATISGADESTYVEAIVPKSALVAGTNTIAVEVHQDRGNSSDVSFKLELLKDQLGSAATCATLPATALSNFVSVQPSAQTQTLVIPSTHIYQVLTQTGDAYTTGTGTVKAANDFTGYVPISGSSTNGYLSINHEGSSAASSGVSILDLQYNTTSKLWNVSAKNAVDFGPVLGTFNNCSGGTTSWGTVITCEENSPTAPTDTNNDGYLDYGWNVELNPATRAVKDQNGDGTPDKLWRMGRMKHENVVVAADNKTVYEGADDGGTSYVYKYVANTAGNLSNGTLYVLQLGGAIGTATTGTWIVVPNTTPTECNTTTTLATALGATSFAGVEDVEIGPHDGKIYFTSKGSGRVYRFADAAAGVSDFEIFVGQPVGVTNQTYPVNYGTATVQEAWGTGNDNLTFDSYGNLYVLQDGSRNHIWLVKPCHTQAAPAVELFATTPAGSEPTGMTLSPDEKFMFVSIQGPSSTNTLATNDAAGQSVVFNKATTLVIARKENLGNTATSTAVAKNSANLTLYPNPATSELNLSLTHDRREKATVQVMSILGGRVLAQQEVELTTGANNLRLPVQSLSNGQYLLLLRTPSTTLTRQFVKQ
jgi:secreted PhoX family phosphatase